MDALVIEDFVLLKQDQPQMSASQAEAYKKSFTLD